MSKTDRLSKRVASLRIVFGLVWAIDAAFKFEPAFYRGLLTTVTAAGSGQPSWLAFWFNDWVKIINWNPHLFAVLVAVIESLIALALIFGVARKLTYIGGAAFSFIVWAVAEGFGGPYSSGSTDIGTGIIYTIVFLMLYTLESNTSPSWSLDTLLEKKFSCWKKISDSRNSRPKNT